MTKGEKKRLFVVAIFVLGAISILLSSCTKDKNFEGNSGIRYDGEPYVIEIVDKTESSDITTDCALEKFYEDNKYEYYFPTIRSEYIECTLSDGSKINIIDALNCGKASLSDLDFYGINYYMEDKETGNIDKGSAINENKQYTDDGRRY